MTHYPTTPCQNFPSWSGSKDIPSSNTGVASDIRGNSGLGSHGDMGDASSEANQNNAK